MKNHQSFQLVAEVENAVGQRIPPSALADRLTVESVQRAINKLRGEWSETMPASQSAGAVR